MSQTQTVHLGFEVGSGEPVSIPLRHMVVTGQTQEAGKTTALEALISRSGVKAVAFITKRGEGSFAEARTIQPYFRERTDWKFVAAILEASRGEKLKFERPWIIRASKGSRTLADVHRNVRKAMETAKGLAGDIYLTLDAYLEDVVPQIGRVRWADSVYLEDGVNAMDLVALSDEMQQLVIRSTIEWVAENEEATVIVVPEAWKFIPEGRGSPVKLEAESYIRQGAGLRNYLWLDSQDIAGVEKAILKSVPVWILGVQRESNEVKRTLAQIPGGIKKPKAEQVQTLELGQFFACHGKQITKVYVQPDWMAVDDAQAVAKGDRSASESVWSVLRRGREEMLDRFVGAGPGYDKKEGSIKVTEKEARELREQNADLLRRVNELEQQLAGRAVGKQGAKMPENGASGRDVEVPPSPSPASFSGDDEQLYQSLKARLQREAPALVRLLASRPELEIEVSRKTIQLDEFSLKGRIAKLLKEGFFREGRGSSAVRYALRKTGPDANTANIGRALNDFRDMGFVTQEGSNYQEVAGMKVNILEPEYA